MILYTNSPDEIDRILGKGPFFRTQIAKYRDVMKDSVAAGFALGVLGQDKAVGRRMEILF